MMEFFENYPDRQKDLRNLAQCLYSSNLQLFIEDMKLSQKNTNNEFQDALYFIEIDNNYDILPKCILDEWIDP